MALKFERIGNKIVVTDTETSIEYEGRADEVNIKEYPTIAASYRVEGIDGITNLVGYPIPFTEIRDSSGAEFTNEDAWKAWYRSNTSFSNGGGSGNGAVRVVLDSQTIGNGGTLAIPSDVSAYDYIRFETDGQPGLTNDVVVSGEVKADQLSDSLIAMHHDDATGYIYFVISAEATTATLTVTGNFSTGSATWRVIGIKSATSEPATVTRLDGLDAANTLNQTSGTSWIVSTSTSPGNLQFILNSDSVNYVQEGNKRYYSLSFYIDNDSAISFEVVGAIDVVSVSGDGFPLGSGDFASRATIFRRTGVNEITLDRDNDNDVDMRVDATFTAIM